MITTPIITNKNIENSYVRIEEEDVVITNFETSKNISFLGTSGRPASENPNPNINRFSVHFGDSVSSFISSVTGSTSSYYKTIGMTLFSRGYMSSLTGSDPDVCPDIGVLLLKKRKFDSGVQKGSLFMTATGNTSSFLGSEDMTGDYIDDSEGNIVRVSDSAKIGIIDYDNGLLVITSSPYREVALSVTSVSYNPMINNTNISVFCRANPYDLNFSTNHTIFEQPSLSSAETEQRYNNLATSLPLTASTTGSVFDLDIYQDQPNFQPIITSVGLYDDNNECLAIAKLSRPFQKPTDLPITFKVSIDV